MKKFRYASYQIGEGDIGNSWILIKSIRNGYISDGKTMAIRMTHPVIPDFDVYISKDTPEYERYVSLIKSDSTDLIEDDIFKKYLESLDVSEFKDILLRIQKEAEEKGREDAQYQMRKALGL